jgi:hypothetical protein
MPNERGPADATMNDDDREFERAMRALSPARGGSGGGVRAVDPIAAAFAAGQRSSRGALRIWQSATAAAVVVASGALLTSTISPSTSLHAPSNPNALVVVATSPAPTESHSESSSPAPSEQSLIMLLQAVRDRGVDGLPVSRFAPPSSIRRANDPL